MPLNVLIYGERLYSKENANIQQSHNSSVEIAVFDNPTPPTQPIIGTAFVDLENIKLRAPAFLRQLSMTSEQLRVVGIADRIGEPEMIEVAKLGISEVLTTVQFQSRLEMELQSIKSIPVPKQEQGNKFDLDAIIGESPQISSIKQLIRTLSNVDYPNAITFGETGTGKDLVAKVMHYTGLRKAHHLIEVNCSAIPEELFESELFGHAKGAFTDAKTQKIGLFEFANGGTIFLDEIGNLSMGAQAKLLKVLENRKLRPLGTIEEKEINVRVHAATNVNLQEAVRVGRFREDLLFRLNMIAIHIPPLRDRKEDIPEIARRIFDFYSQLYNKPNIEISNDVIPRLIEYNWPGNVRELRNVIERTVLLSPSDKITVENIDDAFGGICPTNSASRQISLDIPKEGLSLQEIERKICQKILNMSDGNRSETARLLGISRGRLRRILNDSTETVQSEIATGSK